MAHGIHARTEVTILVGPSQLELYSMVVVHVPPIVCLEERITEFGESHSFAIFHADLHSVSNLSINPYFNLPVVPYESRASIEPRRMPEPRSLIRSIALRFDSQV